MATRLYLQAFADAAEEPHNYLRRHLGGDWGDVSEGDREENEHSLAQGFRLLSAYTLHNGTRFWIITEADRSVTTFLLPEEY